MHLEWQNKQLHQKPVFSNSTRFHASPTEDNGKIPIDLSATECSTKTKEHTPVYIPCSWKCFLMLVPLTINVLSLLRCSFFKALFHLPEVFTMASVLLAMSLLGTPCRLLSLCLFPKILSTQPWCCTEDFEICHLLTRNCTEISLFHKQPS